MASTQTDDGRADRRRSDDDLPDPSLFWRWVGRATRPVVGWVLLGLAALVMLLGWIGVSGESIVAKQLPFLISGGIGGVVLAVAGAYFLGTEELRKDSGRLDRLEAMVADLHATLLARADAPDVAAPQRANASGNGSSSLVALAGAETYHRTGCPMVEGKDAGAVTPAAVRRRKLHACPLCEPAPVGV